MIVRAEEDEVEGEDDADDSVVEDEDGDTEVSEGEHRSFDRANVHEQIPNYKLNGR